MTHRKYAKQIPRLSLFNPGFWTGGFRRASRIDRLNRTYAPRQFISVAIPKRSHQPCKVCGEPMLVSVGQIVKFHKFHKKGTWNWGNP